MNKLEKLYFSALKAATKNVKKKYGTGSGPLDVLSRGDVRYQAGRTFERKISRGRRLWDAGEHDAEILEGMARAVFADQWAVRKEERGHRFPPQTDIYDAAPRTPPAAKKWARLQAAHIIRMNKLPSLTALFERAKQGGFKRGAESFGAILGLQIVGHGVSVTDDMPFAESRKFEASVKLPQTEFYL